MSRKKTRKLLFQKLYASCFSKYDEKLFLESFFEGLFDFTPDDKYLSEMYNLVIEKEKYLLHVIKKYAPKFDLEKMNIMYVLPVFIGATEMLYFSEEIPAKVSINESVEIAKAFGDTSAKKIVNGILNKLYENYDEVKKELDDLKVENDSFSFFKR